MKLLFYTTLGCHLCEQAANIIFETQRDNYPQLNVESIDIADDDQLFERYGIRIPVVKLIDQPNDLGWPFNADDLQKYLENA